MTFEFADAGALGRAARRAGARAHARGAAPRRLKSVS
jgi:hypothetical protein